MFKTKFVKVNESTFMPKNEGCPYEQDRHCTCKAKRGRFRDFTLPVTITHTEIFM
jgi:hypothetical protein